MLCIWFRPRRYSQFAPQYLHPNGPNPWKMTRHCLSTKKSARANQLLEQTSSTNSIINIIVCIVIIIVIVISIIVVIILSSSSSSSSIKSCAVNVCVSELGVRPISLLTLHPTNIAWLKLSGKFPMDLRIPPRKHNIMLESTPLKSTMLVGRLAVVRALATRQCTTKQCP